MTPDPRSLNRFPSAVRRAASILSLAACAMTAADAVAQPLPAACANGGPNYQPFSRTEFLPGDIGTPMLRYTLPGPNSLCNDGSQAVMYIRPASAYYTGPQLPEPSQLHERWVIVFDGGGGCGDAEDCLARWCDISGGYNRAGKMSTLGAYDAITGVGGILSRNPALNDFAGYNQVLLNYCSSDQWVGSETHTGVVPSSGPSYDIEFQGEAIVKDAFTQLLAGVAPDPGPAAKFWSDSLPWLRSAEEVVLVGLSAGGTGLRHHLDRLDAWLRGRILASDVEIVGVIDAGMTPDLSNPAFVWPGAPDPADYTDYLHNWVAARHAFWGTDPTAIDSSCQNAGYAAAHNAFGIQIHPEICYDTTYTLLNHITTPFFARQDIHDLLGDDRYVDWGLYPSAAAFMADQSAQLVYTATFSGGLEPISFDPGVSGTHCRKHVTVLGSDFFSDTPVSPGGLGLSFHDLLSNWISSALPAAQVQPDFNAGPIYTPSNC